MLQLGLGCLTNPPKGGVVSLCAREVVGLTVHLLRPSDIPLRGLGPRTVCTGMD